MLQNYLNLGPSVSTANRFDHSAETSASILAPKPAGLPDRNAATNDPDVSWNHPQQQRLQFLANYCRKLVKVQTMNFTLSISKNDFSKRNYFLSSANNSQSYFWFPLDYYKTSNIDHFELNLILAMERYHPLCLDLFCLISSIIVWCKCNSAE